MNTYGNIFGAVSYIQIPKFIVFCLNQITKSPVAISVYSFLLQAAEMKKNGLYCPPISQTGIADYLYCSRKTVNRVLRTLADAQFIEIDENKGKECTYTVLKINESKTAELIAAKNKTGKKFINNHKNIIEVQENITINEPKPKKEEIHLDKEQISLKKYIENSFNIKLTNRQINILFETAKNNPEIDNQNINKSIGTIIDTILNYLKTVKTMPDNPFGYIKKAILKHQKPEQEPKIEDSEYFERGQSMSLKLQAEYTNKKFHLTTKQCVALCSAVDNKIIKTGKSNLDITNFIFSEIINKSIHFNNSILDPFKYFMKIINTYDPLAPIPEKKEKKKFLSWVDEKQSYDIEEFEKFAVTLSKNTKNTTTEAKQTETINKTDYKYADTTLSKLTQTTKIEDTENNINDKSDLKQEPVIDVPETFEDFMRDTELILKNLKEENNLPND